MSSSSCASAIPDPAQALVDWEQDYIEALRQYRDIYGALGLDRPVLVQYGIHLKRTLTGQFGKSTIFEVPALTLLKERFVNSAKMGAAATVLAVAAGIPLGIVAALNRGTMIDTATTTFSVLGLTVPNFWQALLMILGLRGVVEVASHLRRRKLEARHHARHRRVVGTDGRHGQVHEVRAAGGLEAGLRPHGQSQGSCQSKP